MNMLLQRLTQLEKFVAAVFILILTAFVITDVMARELFQTGLPWAQKASVQLMIWAGFLGAALMAQKGDHLRPEAGDKLWKGKAGPIAERVRNFLVMLFCSTLAYHAVLYVLESKEFAEEHVVLQIPLWWLQLVIPWTFFSMALRYGYFTWKPLVKTERSLH
jgi:TRAP-type C4-dicarboxylate transport system permease small subunit